MTSDTSTAPTRVLLTTDNLRIGGVQRIVVELAKALTARGFLVHVAADAEGPLWGELGPFVGRHHPKRTLGPLGLVSYASQLRALIRKLDIDIIHPHQRGVALAARLGALGTGIPVIEHVHNTFQPVNRKLTSFRGHFLVACGPTVESMLINDYGRPRHRTHLVVNGVEDRARDSHITSPPFSKPSQYLSILGIGRLSEQKNPEKFVRVVAALQNLGVAVRARWLGDGELREKCEKLVKELKATDIEFVGAVSEISPYIENADFLLMTSRWEGLPLAALEVLSLGRGIIVPDIGSCAATVSAGNGIVYHIDSSIDQISSMLAEIAPADVQRWSKLSRNLFESDFTLDRMTQQVTDLYSSALSTPRGWR